MIKIHARTSLCKARTQRLLTYLDCLEATLPKPSTVLAVSQRMKLRQEQKYRNYMKAINIVRYLVTPKAETPNFKNTMQYKSGNEIVQLHRKGRPRKIRQIQECKKPNYFSQVLAS